MMGGLMIDLLSEEQVKGLETLRERRCEVTDLAILTGCQYEFDKDTKKNIGSFYTKDYKYPNICDSSIRPILYGGYIFDRIYPYIMIVPDGTEEVRYGEFPQYAPGLDVQNRLSYYRSHDDLRTVTSYTFGNVKCKIYYCKYYDKKYVYAEYNKAEESRAQLSNGITYKVERVWNAEYPFGPRDGHYRYKGDSAWIEISPVEWIVDEKNAIIIAKKGLLSGIRFGDLGGYLHQYMQYDLTRFGTFYDEDIQEAITRKRKI